MRKLSLEAADRAAILEKRKRIVKDCVENWICPYCNSDLEMGVGSRVRLCEKCSVEWLFESGQLIEERTVEKNYNEY